MMIRDIGMSVKSYKALLLTKTSITLVSIICYPNCGKLIYFGDCVLSNGNT